MKFRLSDSTPLAEWPGIQDLSGYDEGNYLTILARAYTMSVRWAEWLTASTNRHCGYKYTTVDNLQAA